MRRVLGSLVLGMILFLVSCSQDKYQLTTFKKNETWGIKLEIYQKTEGSIILNMQESIFDEDKADNALKLMKDDLKKIKKFNKLTNDIIEVYILDKAFFDNSIYVGGNKISCTYDSIENNEYREQIVRAAYNLTEPAIIHGLTAYIFGNNVDVESLKDYYSKSDDISILGLFGARFYEEWNSEEDLKIANDTATELVRYCVENDKKDLVISQKIDNELKQQWLNSLGVNRTYENEYDLGFNLFTFNKGKQYSLIIDSDKARYNMFTFDYLAASKAVEEFIYKDIQGRSEIIKFLKINAPKNFNNLNIDTKPIYSYDRDLVDFAGTSRGGGNINLSVNGNINPHLHEYTHAISYNWNSKIWMSEGLAEYISMTVYKDNYTLEAWAKDVGKSDSESYIGIAEDYYLANGGDITYGSWDGRLLLDARAYAAKKYYSDKGKFEKNNFNIPLYKIYNIQDSIEGIELSYYEAGSFTAYLIDKYSLDTYLSFYIGDLKNGTFEDAFGITYSKAKEDWINYVGIE